MFEKITFLQDEKYYVYFHAVNREIFYIGKGYKNRYKDIITREKEWKQKVYEANYFNTAIIKYFNSEKEAFDCEKILIYLYSNVGVKLINKQKSFTGFLKSLDLDYILYLLEDVPLSNGIWKSSILREVLASKLGCSNNYIDLRNELLKKGYSINTPKYSKSKIMDKLLDGFRVRVAMVEKIK